MCARRFLLAVFALTLLAAAGGLALFQFGGQALKQQATPKGSFRPPPPTVSGPDYTQNASWIARPGLQSDPSSWVPQGAGEASAGGTAAVFYIHPTTYLRRDRWNAPLDDGESRDRAALFVRSQASAFTAAGQVWAPRYRQAAFGAFLLRSRDAEQALNFAYGDVARAFGEFLKQAGDRPIILAGHSQGALHLTRLLKEQVAGKPVAERVVAAYVGGWPVSVAADIPAMGLRPCTQADQPGCILSWQSFAEPANTDLVTDVYDGSIGFNGQKRQRQDMLCVNPLTGTQDGRAPPQANLGTLVPNADLTDATLAIGKVGARCEGGFLLLDGDIPPLGPYVLFGNNYHVYDYALFWASLRKDAERRLASWQGR